MFVYGVSANASVEQLFVAGIVPGLLGAVGLMSVAYAFAVRYDLTTEEAFNTKRVKKPLLMQCPPFCYQ